MLIVGGAIVILLIVVIYSSGMFAPIMNANIAGKYVDVKDNSNYYQLNSDGTYVVVYGAGNPSEGTYTVTGNNIDFCFATITTLEGKGCLYSRSGTISNNQITLKVFGSPNLKDIYKKE